MAAPGCRSTSRWTMPHQRAWPGSRAPVKDGDRARHPGARRGLTRRQRGRARAPTGGGDDRRGPAVRGRPDACAGGRLDLWIQLQELPAGRVKGDAAGELDVGDGTWTEKLREAYADRICARLGESITNLESATLERVVLSPADLEAAQLQSRRRRHLLGLVRARPEPPLAAAGRASRPRHVRRLALADRREHPPGPGARSRLGLPRRQGADEATASAAPPREASGKAWLMRLGLSEISTVNASFEEDVVAYAARRVRRDRPVGVQAPTRRRGQPRAAREYGLEVAVCVPAIPAFLSLGIPGMEGPDDPAERVERSCASITRLAQVLPADGRLPVRPAWQALGGIRPRARRRRSSSRRRAARVADVQLGARADPPLRTRGRRPSSTRSRRPRRPRGRRDGRGGDPARHLPRLGRSGRVGLHRAGVVSHRRRPRLRLARGSRRVDRELPGCGISQTKELIEALAISGWDGILDIEIFGDPEGYWGLDVDEAARQAHAAITAVVG